MNLVRTTIRLEPELKKAAETEALKLNITFQEILAQALRDHLHRTHATTARKIVFKSQPLGVPLDQLTRED